MYTLFFFVYPLSCSGPFDRLLLDGKHVQPMHEGRQPPSMREIMYGGEINVTKGILRYSIGKCRAMLISNDIKVSVDVTPGIS